MTDFEIRRETLTDGGRYIVTLPGIAEEAELTWVNLAPGTIAATHTYAPPEMRGHGVAPAMLKRLIEDARAENLKILPICSYVRAEFDRHRDWNDLRADSEL